MFTRIFRDEKIGKFLKKWAKVSMVIHIVAAALVLVIVVGMILISVIGGAMDNAAERETWDRDYDDYSYGYDYDYNYGTTTVRQINMGATLTVLIGGVGIPIALVLLGLLNNALLYAFGTLVDSSATQQRLLEKQTYLLNQIAQAASAAPAGDSPSADDTLPPL